MSLALDGMMAVAEPRDAQAFERAKLAALAFVDAVNTHDPARVAATMTLDHVFIDASGMRHKGRETMRAGWREYFGWFPDYEIQIETVFPGPPSAVPFDSVPSYTENANVPVALFGWAKGTASSQFRPIPNVANPERYTNSDEPIRVRGRIIASPKRTWRVPGAWLAVVRDGQVAEWRTYCDLEPIFRSLGHDRWEFA